METELSQEEQDIVRRGRNTRSHPPKNADVQSYRMSTGFEALLGYLYLNGNDDRLNYLLQKALEEI
jgi:ribonuclease-3 family protein